MTHLCTQAWLLRGISTLPGELCLHGELLTFTCLDTGSTWPFQLRKLGVLLEQPGLADAVERGQEFELFEWPVREIEVSMPWYYFGAGLKLVNQGVNLRFSFCPPSPTYNTSVRGSSSNLSQGLASGRLWSQALAEFKCANQPC